MTTTAQTTSQDRRTKVKIELTLDVNVDYWNLDYGTETVAEVREDVKRYVRTMLAETGPGERWAWQVQK